MVQDITFNVVVVGAGLGGLATAIALARKGHKVTLLEAAQILGEVGADNACILKYLGLVDKFKDVIVWPKAIILRRYSTGEKIGSTPLDPYLTDKYGAPYWLIHRADYHRILHDGAVENGVEIHTGSRVVEVDEVRNSVTTDDGTVYTADVIIAADGIRSIMRAALFPEFVDEFIPSGTSAFRATVQGELMAADPELKPFLDSPYAHCWIGPGCHIMSYPIRNKSLYNLVMLHPGDTEPGQWNLPGSTTELLKTYENWDPTLVKILKLVKSCLKWRICYLKELPTWINKTGSIALLGDAAHAMVPFLAQGAAQAIEDGACIAECLSAARTKDDIPDLLHLYERIRKPRSTRVQLGAIKYGDVWHREDGPEQEKRDEAMLIECGKLEAEDAAGAKRVEVDYAAEVPSYDLKNPNFWSDDTFQPWLFGHDAVKTARYHLEKAGYL